jgi:hypothetical protein
MTIDLNMRLVHAPIETAWALVLSEYLLQHWQELDRPAVDTELDADGVEAWPSKLQKVVSTAS